MEIAVLTPGEAAYWAVQVARASGRPVRARGRDTLEVQNVTINVKYPHLTPYLPERDARHFIGAVEALQLVGQVADPDAVVAGSKSMGRYLDDGIFWGAYGARAYGQLSRAESLLLNDAGTRQAVVSIYDGARDLEAGTRDIPCTLTLQFLWQDGRLGMRTSMRSNDVWLGLPYDLFQFTSLQMAMADALDVELGTYTHTVGSLHIYDADLGKAAALRAPGEPLAHEIRRDSKAWGGQGAGPVAFGDISARARAILAGRPIDAPTDYEMYLMTAMGAR